MKTILGAGAVAIGLALCPGPATAQVVELQGWQWCAVDSESGDAGCAYSSLQQCLLAFNQTAGICYQNPDYRPTVAARPTRKARSRRT